MMRPCKGLTQKRQYPITDALGHLPDAAVAFERHPRL